MVQYLLLSDDFDLSEREGQWFYYFETKDAPVEGEGLISRWPESEYGYQYLPGPYLGCVTPYLLYGSSSKTVVEENEYIEFRATGCEVYSNISLLNICIRVLYPNGMIKSYEMDYNSSYILENINEMHNSCQYLHQLNLLVNISLI